MTNTLFFSAMKFIFCILIYINVFHQYAHSEIQQKNGQEIIIKAEDIPKVLRFLSLQLRSNSESIKTWKGKYEFHDATRFDGSPPVGPQKNIEEIRKDIKTKNYIQIIKGEMQFWLDSTSQELKVIYNGFDNPEFLIEQEKKKIKSKRSSFDDTWVITPEHFLDLSESKQSQIRGFPQVESVNREGGFGRVLYRRSKDEAYINSRFFDPRRLFGNGHSHFAETCEIFAEALSGELGEEEKEKASKAISIIEINTDTSSKRYIVRTKFKVLRYPSNPGVVETTFDSSAGYNVTQYKRYIGGGLQKKRTFTYKNVSDTYIPMHAELESYKTNYPDAKNRPLFAKRTLTLIESELNTPIDPSAFQIESLNLKYGERMLDTINKQLFVQDKTGLVLANDFVYVSPKVENNNIPGEKRQSNNLKTIFTINIILITILFIFLYFRGKKQASE